MRAFDGEFARGQLLLDELDAAIAAGRFCPDDPHLPAGADSVLIALFGKSDAKLFEQATAIPASLGVLMEALVRMRITDRAAARQFARDWVKALTPGADYRDVPTRIAVFLLEEAARLSDGSDVTQALDAIRALHLAVLDGKEVARMDWSGVRTAALAVTDATDDQVVKEAGRVAEALAWDARSSRSILADGVRPLASLIVSAAVTASGWSSADRLRVDALMQSVWVETAAIRESDPEAYSFPETFAKRHPMESAGFQAALDLSNRVHGEAGERICAQMLALLRQTSTI